MEWRGIGDSSPRRGTRHVRNNAQVAGAGEQGRVTWGVRQSKTTFSQLQTLRKLYMAKLDIGTACVACERLWDHMEAVRTNPQNPRTMQKVFALSWLDVL